MTQQKAIILGARIISLIFNPFYLPLVGIMLLLTFTFMIGFPMEYKLMLLAAVYLLTVLIPTMLIFIYRIFRRWTLQELGQKRNLYVPYAISIGCYSLCVWLLYYNNVFHDIIVVVIAALAIQVVSIIINLWWKVSIHTAAIGGVSGALVAFGLYMYNFNPVWWLTLSVFLAGLLGSARMILRQHSLGQVVTGYLVGAATSFCCIFFI